VPELEEKLSGERDLGAAAHLRVLLALDREQIERLKAACQNCGEPRYRQLSDRKRALHDGFFSVNSGDPQYSIMLCKKYHALQELTFDDQGKQQTMLRAEGRRPLSVPQGCERRKAAGDFLADRARKIFGPSAFALVRRLVRFRSHRRPDKKSRSLEEDDFHSDLRRERWLLRSRALVCRPGSEAPRDRASLERSALNTLLS
jgi:hypothetical protein